MKKLKKIEKHEKKWTGGPPSRGITRCPFVIKFHAEPEKKSEFTVVQELGVSLRRPPFFLGKVFFYSGPKIGITLN